MTLQSGGDDKRGQSLDAIARKAERLHQTRRKKEVSPLHGLSAFGVIGWSIAVPAVAGALLGRWLNRVAPQTFSWTLALILGGLVLGIGFAWSWMSQAQQLESDEQKRLSSSDGGQDEGADSDGL